MRCFQSKIRNEESRKLCIKPPTDLKNAFVRALSTEHAREIILRYEWLRTMGSATAACYGLFSGRKAAEVQGLPDYCNVDGEELVGVACFGWSGGLLARDICGQTYRDKAVCLQRGACVHWAHPHSASFLISHACKAAHREHGWQIFYAYADESAGEIGTVYQACNWVYIGRGVGRTPGRYREDFVRPSDGKRLSSRTLRHLKLLKSQVITDGWEVIKVPPKHKYVWFEGGSTVRKRLRKALRYASVPYPKRT